MLIPVNNLLNIGDSLLLGKRSFLNFLFQITTLTVLADDKYHLISQMLRHDLYNMISAPQFPHDIHLMD